MRRRTKPAGIAWDMTTNEGIPMAAPTDETTFLSQALAWAAAGIAGVGAWLWTTTMGRIAELEKGKVSKADFESYVNRADKDRDERRQTELSLFEKVDDLHKHFDVKIDKLADLIRNTNRP